MWIVLLVLIIFIIAFTALTVKMIKSKFVCKFPQLDCAT